MEYLYWQRIFKNSLILLKSNDVRVKRIVFLLDKGATTKDAKWYRENSRLKLYGRNKGDFYKYMGVSTAFN